MFQDLLKENTILIQRTGIVKTDGTRPSLYSFDICPTGIIITASRARDLSWQFLAFSQDRKADRKSSDIGALLKETVPFALRGLPVVFKIYTPENLWKVSVDEGQFCQVIDNIAINAAQAMPDGGMLQIKCDNVILSRDKHYLPLKGGRYVKISARDTGTGIAPENISRIFDPYFSTKEMGHGLGLTICYSIIKKHEGHIEVESKPDLGTLFTIYLPACDKVTGPVP